MQAYGTGSHFETRHTDLYPSKSSVIGMLAASLGYRRHQSQSINQLNDLDFAVRVDQAGSLLRDYHTARKYKRDGKFDRTYVTHRYYLEDAIFVVGLAHEDERWIDQLSTALQHPYFQPFMGRRALPLPADFFLGQVDGDVLTALCDLPWQASDWYQKKHPGKISIYVDGHLHKTRNSNLRRDVVLSFDQKHRQFDYRRESRLDIQIKHPTLGVDHDAFGAIEGGV